MATDKKDYGVNFVNVELRFKPELYLGKGEALPDEKSCFQWLQTMAKDYFRVGVGWSEQSSSFTASLTYKGGKPTEKPDTVTQHGKSVLSAIHKLWIIFELCGGKEGSWETVRENIAQLETYVEDALSRLME